MPTIRVIDPRLTVQEWLEKHLIACGYQVDGYPDLVLTTQRTAARYWTQTGTPVAVYDADDVIDMNEIMALVGSLLDQKTSHPNHR